MMIGKGPTEPSSAGAGRTGKDAAEDASPPPDDRSAAARERLERLIESLRRYSPSDRERLRAFQARFFGGQARQLEEDRFRWLFAENPAGEKDTPEFWLCDRGEIVGQQAGIAHRLKVGGREVRAVWAVDLMVDPKWRLRGVGPALSERMARSHPVSISLGATDLLYPVLLHAGWTDLGTIPTYVRPLKASRLEAWWQRRGAPARRLAQLAVPALKASDAWFRTTNRGYRLERFGASDERIDRIWNRVSPGLPILARRDRTALAWRFEQSPDEHLYRRYSLTVRGVAVGYIVLREGVLLGAPVCFVVDLLCPRPHLRALLTMAARIGEFMGVGAMVLDLLYLPGGSAIRSAGYFSIRKKSPRRFLWRTQPELTAQHAMMRDRTNWFVTRADGDWDHPDGDSAEDEERTS